MSGANGHDQNITVSKTTVLQLVYDHDTNLVHMKIEGVKVSLAQMIVDEATRQLDIIRRQAAALELQKQLAEKAKAQAIADSIFGKG